MILMKGLQRGRCTGTSVQLAKAECGVMHEPQSDTCRQFAAGFCNG